MIHLAFYLQLIIIIHDCGPFRSAFGGGYSLKIVVWMLNISGLRVVWALQAHTHMHTHNLSVF